MPSAATLATDAVSPSGNASSALGMSAAPGLTSVTGQAAFSASYDAARRCWVIRQRGTIYSVIPTGRRYPAHTERYIRRILDILNQETT